MNRIIATNETIKDIVKQEITNLGVKANLNHIDVSQCTSLQGVFACTNFQGDVSQWDVSSVINMSGMFSGCKSFTGKGLENWSMEFVERTDWMFHFCESFNIDVSNWKLRSNKTMYCMFNDCASFEGVGLDKWVDFVNDVFDITGCLDYCSKLNEKYIEGWQYDGGARYVRMLIQKKEAEIVELSKDVEKLKKDLVLALAAEAEHAQYVERYHPQMRSDNHNGPDVSNSILLFRVDDTLYNGATGGVYSTKINGEWVMNDGHKNNTDKA